MNALKNYSSKNDVNICQIVAYKDNKLCLEEYHNNFTKEDTLAYSKAILAYFFSPMIVKF